MLSIITVNYSNRKSIEALWESLKAQSFQDFEWIIVDNNSPRGEGSHLEAYFESDEKVHVIPLTRNIGFGGANDEGVKFAHGEVLALVNPDIKVHEDCFSILLDTLRDPKNQAGIVSPRLLDENGKSQESARRFPTFWELFGRRMKVANVEDSLAERETLKPVDWLQGSFLVMERDFFVNKLTGFDHRFFLFLEDTDLCRRTWEAGARVLFQPQALADHGSERLSGGSIFTAVFKSTFWIHVVSTFKYFWKYRGKSKPEIF